MPAYRPIEERFFEKISPEPNSGCWLWTATGTKQGYGLFCIKHTSVLAHRVSYELHHGKIPDGLMVLHNCDNPSCVNPDHLRVGTNADNMRDKRERNRSSRLTRDKIPHAKMTADQVRYIRTSSSSEASMAREIGVSRSTIRNARLGICYRDVV